MLKSYSIDVDERMEQADNRIIKEVRHCISFSFMRQFLNSIKPFFIYGYLFNQFHIYSQVEFFHFFN
jgi:hypothetical protein